MIISMFLSNLYCLHFCHLLKINSKNYNKYLNCKELLGKGIKTQRPFSQQLKKKDKSKSVQSSLFSFICIITAVSALTFSSHKIYLLLWLNLLYKIVTLSSQVWIEVHSLPLQLSLLSPGSLGFLTVLL